MAEVAVELLMDQLHSRPVAQVSHTINAELRIRESTGPAKS